MNGIYYKFDKNLLTKEYQFVLTKRRVKKQCTISTQTA